MALKTNDPQIVVTGKLKSSDKGEFIVFSLELLLFELVCIVNIPGENENEAPVYVKFKVKGVQVPADDRPRVAFRSARRFHDPGPAADDNHRDD